MFDRCRAWRRLLSRQAEGSLTPSERALLDTHLTQCAACRKTEAADKLLRSACSSSGQHMSPRAARAFDDRVLQTLRTAPETASVTGFWQKIRAFSPGLSFEFWGQLAGGALMASAVTAFFLVSALHPTPTVRANSASDVTPLSTPERNTPPVSLEALFQTRSPRAALLWAAPSVSHSRSASRFKQENPAPAPVENRRTEPKPARQEPRPHSEQTRTFSVG